MIAIEKNKGGRPELERIGLCTCSKCGISKLKERKARVGHQWRYVDESGRPWTGRTCAECFTKSIIQKNRAAGRSKPLDDVTEPRWVKGRAAEKTAKAFMESQGFSVRLGYGRGPDLIADKDGRSFAVEVKSTSRAGERSWSVCPVYPLRTKDDMVAIVLPNNHVVLQTMQEHLSACSWSGRRTVTDPVRRFA